MSEKEELESQCPYDCVVCHETWMIPKQLDEGVEFLCPDCFIKVQKQSKGQGLVASVDENGEVQIDNEQ